MVSIGTGPRDPRAWVRAAYKLIEAAAAAAPGDKLPAQAQITAGLGISEATVRRACRELARLGVIRLVPGHGLLPRDRAMTTPPDLSRWLRQQREQRSWTRAEMARRLIRAAQVSGDSAMPAAEDVAANIYRWERGTVTPSDRYRLYYCHTLGIPPDRFGDPGYDPTQDTPRVIITISLPEGTDTQIKLTSTETQPQPGTET
jgi:DNA-binding transcriptional MocR family regulator